MRVVDYWKKEPCGCEKERTTDTDVTPATVTWSYTKRCAEHERAES